MLMRPVRRVGRRGVLGTAARTAVVAGTATATVGAVSRHQQNKAAQAAEAEAYEQQQQQAAMQAAAQQAAPPAAAPAATGPVAELERLAQLKQQGVLTDEEFAAAKSKLLGI
jgi:Short C-terminal domain